MARQAVRASTVTPTPAAIRLHILELAIEQAADRLSEPGFPHRHLERLGQTVDEDW
jgi:hypothetical protein